jgi:beta-glucosidase-like glycosyl hydrolase
MRAVAAALPIRQRVIGALEAGVDALLVCSDHALWQQALETLEGARPALLEEPLRRVRALKERYAHAARARAFADAAPPYTAHQQLAARFAESTTRDRPRGSLA